MSFSDLVKKANKEKEEEKKKQSSFGTLVEDAYSGKTNVASKISGSQVSDWGKSVLDVGKRAYNFLSTDGYSTTDTSLAEEMDGYLSEAGDVLQYLRANKNNFSDYDNIYASYVDLNNYLKRLQSGVNDRNTFLSQFGNEEEYQSYKEFLAKQEELKKMAESEQGATGWQKYLDDKAKAEERKKQAREDEKWWETLGRHLGTTGPADTTLSPISYAQLVDDVSKDTSLGKPQDDWTEEQKHIYGYLYSTSQNKATQYARETNEYNNLVAEEEALKKIAELATSNFWAGAGNTIGAIATAPLGLADYLADLVQMNATGTISTDGNISPFEYSQAVTGGISSHLNKEFGTLDDDVFMLGGKGLGDVYGLGTSIAQSMASAYALGPGVTLISYFGQGAASGVDEALSRGASDEQAIKYGAALGTFEAVAEEIGVERLFKLGSSATIKGFIKNVLKQAGTEGTEELLTSFLSTVADDFVMRDKSNFNVLVAQYMASGMSESEAKKKALKDTVGSIAFDTIAGAVSGGISGGVHTSVNNIASNTNAKKIYGDGASLVTEALDIDPNNAYAQQMQAKVEKGKELSGGQINRLVEVNEQALRTQDTAKMKSAVEARLTQLGETGDTSKLADVIVKAQSGGKLTTAERNVLINSKYGRRVSTELNPQSIKSGEYSSAWAENIGTERINTEAYNRELYDLAVEKSGGEVGEKNVSVTESTPIDKIATEGKLEVSADGKTKIGDTEVSIKEIASIKDGEMTLRLEDGSTVNANDVEYGSSGEALLYENVVDLGLNAETANAFIRGYNPSEGLTAREYALGFREAYRYGEYGYPVQEMSMDGHSAKLSEEQKLRAYNLGKIDAKYKVQSKQEKVASTSAIKAEKIASKSKKKGKVHYDGNTKGLTDRQRVSLKGLESVAEALGVEFHLFESEVGADGKRKGANGWFDPKDGSLHIDLYAGLKGEGTILFTAAHELTHFIREWSPAKFKVFADFLLEQYGQKGISVDALVRSQIEKAKRNGRDISFDTAYEEVIADSCESMLADGDVVQKLAELKAKDKTLWEKIKEFITDLVAKIKSVYEGLTPDSVEGRYVAEMLDAAERLKALWTEALVDAGENFSSAEKTLAENGIAVNSDTNSASLMSVRDVLTDEQRQKVSSALATRFGVTPKEAMDWLKAETSMASLILNPKYSQYLDYTADPNEVAIKQNSDYPQGTVDFSPICAKRREFTSVMNNILRLFPNHVFAATDLAKIRSIMEEEGMTIPCGICYVEDRRQLDTIVAQNFIDSLKLYREGSKTRPDGKAFNANQLKGLSLTDGDSYTPSIYELVSLEGLNVLKAKNPNMAEAWVKFNNARGMQSVRLLANEAEYKRQILKYSKATVKSKNDRGGLRVYSFSDAEMFHLIDIIQVITDSATVGLSLQGYTKVNEYARTVKDTGEKLNRSLIPKGELGYHIENGKVVLDYDTVEGIDINHPDFFDNKDNPDVGNITIGVSDVQIRAAMVSDFVDQIIPFHTGQSEEVLGEKGIATWTNYKDFQTEKDIATGKVSDHQINIYTEVLQVLENEGKPITKRTFVEKFLQVCKENNLTPRFSQFLNTNEKGEYVYTEGYHKMLVDFKTFAQTEVGEYLPQKPVKPIFDNEYITKILKAYVKSQKVKDADLAKSMPKVIERITNEIVKLGETKLSDRVIPTGIELPDGTKVDKNGKPRSAQAQRDAGYMLSESKFYSLYNVHKLDIGKRWGDLEKQAEDIKKNGFKGGSGAINIVPSSLMMGFSFVEGKPKFTNIVQAEFAPRAGDKLLFVPENKVKNNKVVQGFTPLEYELVTVEYDYQPYYELYSKAYNQAYNDIRYSDRDSTYMDAVNRGDMETAQKMVDEAAKEAGYSEKVYHGTPRFGFTKISVKKSDDGISFFATEDLVVASSYTGAMVSEERSISKKKTPLPKRAVPKLRNQIKVIALEFLHEYTETLGYYDSWYMDSVEYITNRDTSEIVSPNELIEYATTAVDTISATHWNTMTGKKHGKQNSSRTISEETKQKLTQITEEHARKLSEVISPYQESGVYGLYANTDNHLVIDAQGSRWNDIKSESLPSRDEAWTTRDVAQYAKENGYSGVTFKNIVDPANHTATHPATVYAFLEPQSQLRSADAITYDKFGRVIPLDKRFNPKKKDIRYSDRVSNQELAEMDDTALYIKNTSKANYIGMIFNGTKTEETRSRRTLDAFIGKDFYVTDGRYVYGSIVLGEPHQYTEAEFHKTENQKKHRVPKGDEYDVKPGGTKWAYPIESYEKFDKPKKLSDTKEYKNSFQARQAKFSDRDSEGNTLTKAQQEFFKDSKVRDAEGNLMVMYHGTNTPNFTVFDPSFSDDKTSLFFTDSPSVADSYTTVQNGGRNIDPYRLPNTVKTVEEYNQYMEDNGLEYRIVKVTDELIAKATNDIEELVRQDKRNDYHRSRISELKRLKGKYINYNGGVFYITRDDVAYNTGEEAVKAVVEDKYWVTHKFGNRYSVYLNMKNPYILDSGKTYKGIGKLEIKNGLEDTVARFTINDEDFKVTRGYRESYEDFAKRFLAPKEVEKFLRKIESEREKFIQEEMEVEGSTREEVIAFWERHGGVETGEFTYKVDNASINYTEPGHWKHLEYDGQTGNTRALSKWAKDNGHDGVIIKNLRDIGGYSGGTVNKAATIVIAFDSNQVKATSNKNPTSDPDIRYSLRGETKDGIEVYETSEETKKLSYKERKAQFLKLMTEDYKGRTAKFYKNGHYYYALFDEGDVRKTIYGDNQSSKRGHDAIVNQGADGSIFELVENTRFKRGAKETGKKNKMHNDVLGWDYFVKIVQVDGVVFDLLANVRKKKDGSFVYSLKLKENNMKAEPPHIPSKSNGFKNRAHSAFDEEIISQPADSVKKKFSDRDPDSFSNRSLLANALESVAQNDVERNKLAQYKQKIALIESEQAKLAETRAKIKELSFAKGKRDTEAIKQLQFEANQSANRINTYDRQLLNLESTKALKGVLEREKQMAYKKAEREGKEALAKYRERAAETQRELLTRYQESRKKGVEGRHKTEMRHKIKNVVNELNQYLLRGTKEKHVPIELQKAVAEALEAVNMDTVGAEERIAKLEAELVKAKTPEAIQEISRKIDHIREMGERMDGKLQKLKDAYDDIVNSNDPLVANSHDEVISNSIARVIKEVGSTPLRDMSLTQLEDVYDMYRMVLTTIRNTNKAFKAKKSEEISVIANRVMEEIDKVGKKKLYRTNVGQLVSQFNWNNLKPVYAFERIGSGTFTEVFQNVRAGEDTWAVDVTEAKAFSKEQRNKFKYDSWDFKKRFGFTSTSGMQFELSLDQIMSLYAYSKREQAKDHLKKGGIVFDETTEVTVKTKLGIPVKFNPTQATAYNLSDETLADIISKLTPEQKAFVDVMQDYLSTTMGEKGNEVSLELYGVKLFKEKFYFPLKSATQFMAKAKEQQKGEVKVKNSGFSKETTPKASNPIVLTPFMDVWADHVNEMSMYHAFVLPLEDFYRVFNYKTPASDTMATESVEMFLQNAHGKEASQYIDQLLKDLNGGARVDPTAGVINKMTGLFKKSAVFASASVVVQQPSAIARGMALLDAKHFVGKPAKGKHSEIWAEVKKYAPVAVIKEMGYFDTGMGQSTVEWIKDEKTWKDKVDDIASKAPALADEYAWCVLWNAVKRETLRTRKDLRPNSEEFLMAVGERFTEVVTKTQVYDSVLSRSANMRSKDTGMKMATAFMAEPTTSINMLTNALTQAKRGDKAGARKAVGAVIASMVLNSILVSIVYAGRDDDEDKTYTEKYIGTLTEELLDGFNPLTLIPFVKDIVSIWQGYDVERSDMAVITDVIKAWKNLGNDNRSVYRKVEDFAGAVASIFGLPVKNVMRDVRAMYNTVNSFINGEQTTEEGVKNAITEGLTGESKSNGQQLYEAILSGDPTQIERVKGRFKDQNAIKSAIRTALRENDARIHEAAVARYGGDIAEYTRIAKEIIGEGHFTQDDVVSAINAEINALKKGDGTSAPTASDSNKVTSIYKMDDYFAALVGRDQATAYAVREDIIKTAVANGKDRDEAEADFNSSFTSHLREQYEAGELSDHDARSMLVEYGGKPEDEAYSKVQYWDFKAQYPDYDMSEEAVKKYYADVEPSGISVDVYYDYTKQRAKCKGTDANGDGRTDSGSVKTEVMYVINSLPITYEQKDALYYLNGWSASTIWEAPWH